MLLIAHRWAELPLPLPPATVLSISRSAGVGANQLTIAGVAEGSWCMQITPTSGSNLI